MDLTRLLILKAMAIALVVLAADQALKLFVHHSVALCPTHAIGGCPRLGLAGPLGLVHLHNAGSSGGYLSGLWIWAVVAVLGLLLLLVAFGCILIPLYQQRRQASLLPVFAFGLLAGGGLGNLFDRLVHGGVTDFIDLGRGPVFNLADAAVVLSVVAATWAIQRGQHTVELTSFSASP